MTPPAVLPKIEYASTLADIVAQETRDGRLIVRFLVSAMDGELPDFKPCHRLSAARELLQRGFDYVPDDAEATGSYQATAEPEPDPEEIEAQRRRAEGIKFSFHSPVYYETNPYPCVCEDRLHDCKGDVLDAEQREQAARKGPGNQFFIDEPDLMDDFLARYAECLTRWNAENSHNPIDINRILWADARWKQRHNPVRSPWPKRLPLPRRPPEVPQEEEKDDRRPAGQHRDAIQPGEPWMVPEGQPSLTGPLGLGCAAGPDPPAKFRDERHMGCCLPCLRAD